MLFIDQGRERIARNIIEARRRDYKSTRPHSSIDVVTPQEYAETTSGL